MTELEKQKDVIDFIMYLEEPVNEMINEHVQIVDVVRNLKYENRLIRDLGEFKERPVFNWIKIVKYF